MRSFIAACVLLLTLTAFSLCNSLYMDRFTASLLQPLEQARTCALNHRWAEGAAQLSSFEALWQEKQLYLQVITEHSEIEQAEDLLASLQEFMAQGELPECLSELAELTHQIQLLSQLQRISIGNIL